MDGGAVYCCVGSGRIRRKVGSWVLLIGGLRYLFVLGGLVWQPLRGALPDSLRRKTVCVVQGIVLVVCIAPVIGPAPATGLAATALLVLVYSFVVDTWWLARAHGRATGVGEPR